MPELNQYEGDERKIRYFHADSTATYNMLTNYLSVDRPISSELKQFLIDWQHLSKKSMELHRDMIEAERFTYSEGERELAERAAFAGSGLMEHFEGY